MQGFLYRNKRLDPVKVTFDISQEFDKHRISISLVYTFATETKVFNVWFDEVFLSRIVEELTGRSANGLDTEDYANFISKWGDTLQNIAKYLV